MLIVANSAHFLKKAFKMKTSLFSYPFFNLFFSFLTASNNDLHKHKQVYISLERGELLINS